MFADHGYLCTVKTKEEEKMGKEKNHSDETANGIDKMERSYGRIPFFADAKEKGMPFIRISEGAFKGIVMVIDTGCTDNVMFGYAYQQLKDRMRPLEETVNQIGIDGIGTTRKMARGNLAFCGKEYEMTFVVREDNVAGIELSKEMGFPIAGLIGTFFMAEQGWTIDLARQEIVIPTSASCTTDIETVIW